MAASMAIASSEPQAAQALYFAMESLNVVFPPLVIASLLTGVALTLGTRWGLLDYYWVLTKFVFSFVVSLHEDTFMAWLASPSTLLAVLFAAHVLGLAVATVLSQYKPWGRLPRVLGVVGRRTSLRTLR